MKNDVIVYHLYFFHASSETQWDGSFELGFYSSLEEIEKAKEKYKKLPGFSDYEDGYMIRPVHVRGPVVEPLEKVYRALIHVQDDPLWLDWGETLGVFSTEEQMRAATAEFYALNPEEAQDGDVIFEDCGYCYPLNKMYWDEGFTSD